MFENTDLTESSGFVVADINQKNQQEHSVV